MKNTSLPFPAAPPCANAHVAIMFHSARAQVDKLKEFKEDMELVTNWMKKVEEKVDDIAAILMRAYGGATSDAGIFPRAFPPDERGRHDPYAEPPPAAVSLAPREPLMDNELRQRRDLDEGRYQQRSQYYHVSAVRLTQSPTQIWNLLVYFNAFVSVEHNCTNTRCGLAGVRQDTSRQCCVLRYRPLELGWAHLLPEAPVGMLKIGGVRICRGMLASIRGANLLLYLSFCRRR